VAAITVGLHLENEGALSGTAVLKRFGARRADGKNMFRIMTAGMSADEAKRLCSVLWDRMVGCMVKLVP